MAHFKHFIGKCQFTFRDITVYPGNQDPNFGDDLKRVAKKIKQISPKQLFNLLLHQDSLLQTISIYAPY